MRRLLLAAALVCLTTPAYAVPITYQYVQTGASVPGLVINASLTIDGTFADLPTIVCAPCPNGSVFDFNPLKALVVTVPFGIIAHTFTLADFTGQIVFPVPSGSPRWTISPTGISYINLFESFSINLTNGLIHYDADGMGLCGLTGTCVTSGTFVATPEPETLVLLVTGLAAVCVAHRRSRYRSSPVQRDGV